MEPSGYIDQMWVITILLSLVGAMFGLLVMIVGWMGSKLYQKLSDMATTMHKIETDLHGKISNIDRRVTRLEANVFDIPNKQPEFSARCGDK